MMKKIWTLVRKEWSEVFKNRFVLFTTAFLPLLFAVLPLIMMYAFSGSGGEIDDIIGSSEIPAEFAEVCQELDGSGCLQYYLVSQFMLLFMMVPMIIPVTFASYSIVGEKATHTLEPLLATPIKTIELLAGKALAATIPAVLATWLSFIIFAIGAFILATSLEVVAKILDVLWLTAIVVVGPLLAIFGVSIAVMISSRASDPRVAEQISVLFVLPIVGLFIAQSVGLIFINEQLILWMAVILFVLDIGMLFFATQLFRRETILTRWK
jgi:ABC-2 type transport system permease protein